MSEKIYVRKVETWTISSASDPIEVNVEALRKCEPPYEGDSEQELVNYLQNNVFMEYDFYENENNIEVYGEEAVFDLVMEEAYVDNEFFDSRTKSEDATLQVGIPDEEWSKYGGFQPLASGEYEY